MPPWTSPTCGVTPISKDLRRVLQGLVSLQEFDVNLDSGTKISISSLLAPGTGPSPCAPLVAPLPAGDDNAYHLVRNQSILEGLDVLVTFPTSFLG